MEFTIDRTTGQLYTIEDIDVTPINLFGGIPDGDLSGQNNRIYMGTIEDASCYIYTDYRHIWKYTTYTDVSG